MRTAFAFLLAVGCASPMAALKDDNRRLAQTVSELRVERRAQERRIRDLQRQLDLARAQLVAASADGAVPDLRVEVAAPASASPAASAVGAVSAVAAPAASPSAPAATSPAATSPAPGSRVVGVADDGAQIIYEGDAAAGKPATLDDAPLPALAPSTRPRPAAASRPSRTPTRERELPGDAGNDYRAAVELVKAGNHAAGIAALRAFLAKHPRHDFADNAQYWLGEAYYAQHDYAPALAEFRRVIDTYPRGNKVPDALLKVGYCHQALGQRDKARAVLEQVVTLYPKTEPAATAAKRLESL